MAHEAFTKPAKPSHSLRNERATFLDSLLDPSGGHIRLYDITRLWLGQGPAYLRGPLFSTLFFHAAALRCPFSTRDMTGQHFP